MVETAAAAPDDPAHTCDPAGSWFQTQPNQIGPREFPARPRESTPGWAAPSGYRREAPAKSGPVPIWSPLQQVALDRVRHKPQPQSMPGKSPRPGKSEM